MFTFHNKYSFIFFICFPKIHAPILYGIYNPYPKKQKQNIIFGISLKKFPSNH